MEPPKEEDQEKKPEKEASTAALAAPVAAPVAGAETKPGTADSLRKSTETLQTESAAEPPFKPNDFL